MFLRKSKDIIEDVFSRYQMSTGNEKPCMTINEFSQLFKDLRLNEYIKKDTREISFNMSMLNYVDEVRDDKHIKMRNKLEFCEAFARVVHSLKFPMSMDIGLQKEIEVNVK